VHSRVFGISVRRAREIFRRLGKIPFLQVGITQAPAIRRMVRFHAQDLLEFRDGLLPVIRRNADGCRRVRRRCRLR